MPEFSEKVDQVIDCHVHLWKLDHLEHLAGVREKLGVHRMNLLGIVDPHTGAGHAPILVAKVRYPGAFYCFGGLNHATALSDGKVSAPALSQQVEMLMGAGCDGIKLIEGKPTHRRMLPFPLDGEYYREFFETAERLQVPLLWHVADPEEFWDPQTAPRWAVKHGWTYGADDVPKEQLYAEVENVLRRCPKLRVIFAHFYFLSADLARAERFLADHPNANIDVTPGVELMFNLSRDPERAREFFAAHQERIFYGTDILSDHPTSEALGRAALVRQFLEGGETFTVPKEADELLEPGMGKVTPLDLPAEVLARIYRTNFESFAGKAPKPVDPDSALSECRRQSEVAATLSETSPEKTEAGKCAEALSKIA